MSIRSAYTNWSTTYDSDRNLTRDLDQIVTHTALSAHHYQTILEIGCGTGKNSAWLGQIGDHLCALDFSEGMLAQAKIKTQRDNVLFTFADLTRPWPYASQRANLVVCNLVLEHIEDLKFIFAEAHRVLADGGQFFICELHPFMQYQGGKANFQRGDEKIEIPAFVHHLSDFFAAANSGGFTLADLREWWHEADDALLPPRLVSFMFEK